MDTKTFLDLGISPKVGELLQNIGYLHPTPIQAEVIPRILLGQDVLASAQTGTGKTASYTLPVIELLMQRRTRARMPRALILVPTRELALQVEAALETYCKNLSFNFVSLIGGGYLVKQEKTLKRGVDIIIATPGRFVDLYERGGILLNDIQFVVLDEADRMLDMGFVPEVEKILQFLPSKRQTLMLSATLPDPIRKLAQRFLCDPIEISITPTTTVATTIEQHYVETNQRNRAQDLHALIKDLKAEKLIIFCNRKRDVVTVQQALGNVQIPAVCMHGDMTQPKRQESLQAFKVGEANILIASDVVARGIDVENVSHVINYDVPNSSDDYVHRIGRTGRAGQKGKAYTLVIPTHLKAWKALVKTLGIEVPQLILQGTSAPATVSSPVEIASKVPAHVEVVSPVKAAPKKPEADKRKKQTPARAARKQDDSFAYPENPGKGFGANVPAFFNIQLPKSSSFWFLRKN